jgi:hypothetical protein
MCCTITMPGAVRGKLDSTYSSACVPPVEMPIATKRSVVRASARFGAGAASTASLAPPTWDASGSRWKRLRRGLR